MTDAFLLLPLALALAGAGLATLAGRPAANRRVSTTALGAGLALLPLGSFVIFLASLPRAGEAHVFAVPWMPSLGITFILHLDSLSSLFLLLVSGIGALVVAYAGYYFKGDQSAWRFLAYLFLFMTAMTGLLLAGDIVTLFLFWEGTSIASFLLIGYKTKDEAARRGALKSLFITGGGGVALLAGLLFAASVAGSSDIRAILSSGDALRSSPLYPVILGLIAFGAFTKSAQVPAHIWLPDGMAAPTPASAFLHSATMVKAGIYLMARLNPALGHTELWFWLLTIAGLLTMLTGAYLGLKQNDLKAVLAYSTISQLGVMMMLIGDDTSAAFKALVVSVTAHALYKSALFLVAGAVDHETGTRDLQRLGGLRRTMPRTFAPAIIAGLSMAGLPPMFGFLAKETLLASVTHPTLPALVVVVLAGASVVAGALLLAQAGMLVWDTFMGRPRDPALRSHEAPAPMYLAPAIPALLSLALGLLPEPQGLATYLAAAAAVAFGGPVKVSLALWAGVTPPLILSIVAVTLGLLLFAGRSRVRAAQSRIPEWLSWNQVYRFVLRGLDAVAYWATRSQTGRLRHYLAVMFVSLGVLILVLGRLPVPALPPFGRLDEIPALRMFALVLAVAAGLISVFLRRDFFAILALSASGLATALIMVLEPAPDVALVQVVVDILSVVVLVLALSALPRSQRQRAQDLTFRQSRPGLVRDALIALAAGAVVTVISLNALVSRPRLSIVTPFYEANAKTLTGATDIVGAVVVDFRGFDTLVEITVFGVAGLGVYTLLRYASRLKPAPAMPDSTGVDLPSRGILGIGRGRASPFIRVLADFLLPSMMMLGATHMMYGHDQPGDGFTAGVIISLAIAFWYVVHGYEQTRARLPWLRAPGLVGAGVALAISNALLAGALTGSFFGNVSYSDLAGLRLPTGFNISSSFVFELAICLAVLGGASLVVSGLGHPRDRTLEA